MRRIRQALISIMLMTGPAGLGAFACELDIGQRSPVLADYVERVRPCLRVPPIGYQFDVVMEEDFLHRINAARAEAGLDPVQLRVELSDTVRFHSLDMAYNEFFAHVGPDSRDVAERVSAFDRRALVRFTAENVAMIEVDGGRWDFDRKAVRRLHKNLMNSPGHRANILHPDVTHVGIGVARTKTGVWVTQVFLTLAGTLTQDAPLRLSTGQTVPARADLQEWRFQGFEVMQGDGRVPLREGVPGGLMGDYRLRVEGRRPGEQPLSYHVIRFGGPKVTIGE